MAQIIDLVPPPALTAYVREVPSPTGWILNRFLPDVLVPDIEAGIDRTIKRNRAAAFRTYDAESPIGARSPFERSRVTLPPISEKIPLGEHERLQLERIRSGGSGNTAQLVDQVYDDGANLAGAIQARMELARGDVLTDGKFTLANENGLTLEADFGLPAEHLVAPSVLWSDRENATPVSDLAAWADQYEEATGERPGYVVMSRIAKAHLMASVEARSLAGLTGPGMVATLDNDQLSAILTARDLPEIVVYSAQIDVNGTATRPIAADRVVMLPTNARDLGYTAWGITAESLEFAASNAGVLGFEQLPGLFASVLKEFDPVRTWTKVSGVGMPLIEQPHRLLVADVY
ncbi:major capsid protein [Micrococcus yunnanensis]|nr:major capsid protein [Micrococcus yunnanensis]MCO0632716.1 major capsid protein [Micrococcus yunnanensis]